ncbi:tetraacyldisaccharide 4'-kinase [Nonlabens antarcticus]|uniref:tetraacyldisaccharide 4'-kinase n=1 Tax=Nonlabens antarcticus TaxID=392714 RepID=UPI001891F061|nr:tetraacyldisaccharide 4'-kinase [Nonlabens antarcticus]
MQGLRILLYPFSILYDGITGLRNYGFDRGWLTSTKFDIPIIAVGNLSTGGTGKTPMIEFLIRQNTGKKIAVLSRGYGRKTKGYREVTIESKAIQVGDEPLQFKSKFKDEIIVAVCEKRVQGIQRLIQDHNPEVILLDDAYQHRYVQASHYILLTSYDQPFYKDLVLPAGNLRESVSGAVRAHSIIVTKCPAELSDKEMAEIRSQLKPREHQQVYFSTISYSANVIGLTKAISLESLKDQNITVVTGIAKPSYFVDFLKKYMTVKHLQFPDHYNYKQKDIQLFKDQNNIVITTEKDYVRLREFNISNLYYIPIEARFLGRMPDPNKSDNL